jgi:hypothetical protein
MLKIDATAMEKLNINKECAAINIHHQEDQKFVTANR